MATLSDARLLFTFEYPDGCEVQWKSSSKGQPFLIISSRELKFHLNLVWGPDYGPHTAPKRYTLLEVRSLPVDDYSVNLLVAKGPLLFPLFIPGSIFLGAVVGSLLFFFARQWLDTATIILLGLATAAVALVYQALKAGPTIKYAFVYEGVEYVFTGDWNARKEIDKCVSTIRFK